MNAPSTLRNLAAPALLALVAACAGPGATSVPGAGATTIALPAGFPTGTFTKEISAEDYAAAGVVDPATGNNVGRFTLTLDPTGAWTSVLDSQGATQVNPVFRGTYTVQGTDLAMTTTFPAEYAGAVAHFAWRVDDDGLWTTITSSPDPLELLLAKAIDAEPWVPAP